MADLVEEQLDTRILTRLDFALPPEPFIRRCAEKLGLTETELGEEDVARLVSALRSGTRKLQIYETLRLRKSPALTPRLLSDFVVTREPDQYVMRDLMVRFQPDDDAAFLRFAFHRICGRDPLPQERLAYEFDLRRGHINREKIVADLVIAARQSGKDAAWDSLVEPLDDKTVNSFDGSARQFIPGRMRDSAGRDGFVFCRWVPRVGWLIADNVWRQDNLPEENGWNLHPGWVLAGPKRTLPSGDWRLDFDFIQAEDAQLILDVVANSGLDVLMRQSFLGPCAGAVALKIDRRHFFLELRLWKPEQPSELCWIQLRNLSLSRMGPGE
jgi:hypothetical protein